MRHARSPNGQANSTGRRHRCARVLRRQAVPVGTRATRRDRQERLARLFPKAPAAEGDRTVDAVLSAIGSTLFLLGLLFVVLLALNFTEVRP
jgi:hypothetical protein